MLNNHINKKTDLPEKSLRRSKIGGGVNGRYDRSQRLNGFFYGFPKESNENLGKVSKLSRVAIKHLIITAYLAIVKVNRITNDKFMAFCCIFFSILIQTLVKESYVTKVAVVGKL